MFLQKSLLLSVVSLVLVLSALPSCKSQISENVVSDSAAIVVPNQVQTIYVRADADEIGGDGSLSTPFKTAQKAFEAAYALEGAAVIDLGVGNFGGVNLDTANASEWPSRISVHGVSAADSNLGGIQASGKDGIYQPGYWPGTTVIVTRATSGKNVTILGNGNVNLGDITSHGGAKGYGDYVSLCSGGNISLTSVTAAVVSSRSGELGGGYVPCVGGNISLNKSNALEIISTGKYADVAGNGGNITVLESVVGNISADGFEGFAQGGNGGQITITSSVVGNVSSNGGYGNGGGVGGSIIISKSQVGNVSSNSGDCYDMKCADGGTITVEASSVGNLQANGGSGGDFNGMGSGGNGGTISLLNASSALIISARGGEGGGGEAGNGGIVNLSANAIWQSINVAAGAFGSPAGLPGTINNVQ